MNVLVLNADYQPITLTDHERAVTLIVQNKANIVHTVEEKKLKSPTFSMDFPSVIRLKDYVQRAYKKVPLNRYNIFKRDNFMCAYCGETHDLTLDHIIPRAQGGKSQWINLITACKRCNLKKGDKTPEGASMPLKYGTPHRPNFIMYTAKFSGKLREDWKPYLYQ